MPPNVDITDPQSHLQRASRFQPYSNGKQRVCPVSDAIATKLGKFVVVSAGGAHPNAPFARLEMLTAERP